MQTTATSSSTAYIPISVATLLPSAVTDFSLYLRDRSCGMTLYRGANTAFDLDDLQRLQESGVTRLYVTGGEHLAYQAYLRDNIATALCDERIAPKDRFETLNVVMRQVLQEAFETNNTDETVATTKQLAESAVDMICHDDLLAGDISHVLHHDYHTFTHCANVSYYCVMLAEGMGISNRADLVEMATGGLLHDLGKLEIPPAILTKPSRLTAEEFEIIKTHPTRGFRLLSKRKDLTFRQLMMVYQHHERLDGRGYPVGCCGDEIEPWARLCAVADVYEALTSARPYRAPLKVEEAFQILDRDAATGLDPEMVQCWKRIIIPN